MKRAGRLRTAWISWIADRGCWWHNSGSRDSVRSKYAHADLQKVASVRLKVFLDQQALETGQPMEVDAELVAEHGATAKAALLVSVPTAQSHPGRR